MTGLSAGLSIAFFTSGIDASRESSDSGKDGQSFCDALVSGLVGIVPLLVSAGPAFFLGLPAAERLFDNDRCSVV